MVSFVLRQATPDDRTFLYALYCRTMRSVVQQTWGWDEQWQQNDFDRRFRSYAVSVIEAEGKAIGALMLDTAVAGIIDVVELQIEPEHQNCGIGTAVMQSVIDTARAQQATVTLAVAEPNSRARRLYERLGFRAVGRDGLLTRMRYNVGS
jgi:ribosomal protein S18 acetylase RimI-like enzyme